MPLSYPNPSLAELVYQGRELDSMSEALREPDMTSNVRVSHSRLRRGLLTAIILLGLMFSCLDTSIVSTALVNISVDLHNDFLSAPWVILAYLLTYMALAVGFSKLSDVYGRRNMCAVAWAIFAGFSLVCALANNMTDLIVGRTFQGIGGSGLYSLAQICLVELGPDRPDIVGALVGLTLSISYVLGPLLGGLISSYWSWRGIFYINIPLSVLAVGAIFWLWPPENRRTSSVSTAKLDIVGIFLLVTASALLVFGIQQGGSLIWSWDSPGIISALTVSALCWMFLCFWETLISTANVWNFEPIFPTRLAKRRVYICGLFTTFLTGWTYISLVIDIPERLQIVHGESSLWAGLHLLPMLGACALGSFIAGAVSKSQNRTGPTLVAAALFQLLGTALLYTSTSPDTDNRPIFAYTAVFGFGVGLCFAGATMLTSAEACRSDLAVAQGATAQARVLGGCLGLSACSIIFNARVQADLTATLTAPQLDAVHRSPMAVLSLPAAAQPVVRAVYVGAFRTQMLSMMVVAAMAVLVSLGTLQRSPAPVMDLIAQHKDSPARSSDSELEEITPFGRVTNQGQSQSRD